MTHQRLFGARGMHPCIVVQSQEVRVGAEVLEHAVGRVQGSSMFLGYTAKIRQIVLRTCVCVCVRAQKDAEHFSAETYIAPSRRPLPVASLFTPW